MDIGNIQNTFNISYDQQVQSNNDLTAKVNLPRQQTNQNNKIKPDNIQQQLKEVSKKEETQE